jgi:hypothetical protein
VGTPVWVNEGENRVLHILLGNSSVDSVLYLGLLKNTVAPGEDAKVSDMVEPSGFGYARKPLARGVTYWTITDDTALYAEQTFLAVGGGWGNIYGYFICTSVSGTGGVLLCLEHLGSPFSVLDGKGIKIIPRIKCA